MACLCARMKGQVYTFKVSAKKGVHRTIELKGATSLYHFAEAIVTAFEFQFDHSFGFYDNIKDTYASSEAYTLFYDCGDPVDPGEKSVKRSHIYKVFVPGKKMAFLFDYGDNWIFLVECLSIAAPEAGKMYPIVTGKKGKAPEQYPDLDDDE